MQFQIECNSLKNKQLCLTCTQMFQPTEARLIVCNTQGDSYGDVCPDCVAKGANWIKSQLKQFNNRKLPSLVG
ncbi:hypothetical protein NUACC21_73540 [Scytonema sp. NUACC21]